MYEVLGKKFKTFPEAKKLAMEIRANVIRASDGKNMWTPPMLIKKGNR